jgi:hypothetical protein
MENSCNPLLHGKGKVAVPIRAERNRSFSAPKGTRAAVSLSQSQSCLLVFPPLHSPHRGVLLHVRHGTSVEVGPVPKQSWGELVSSQASETSFAVLLNRPTMVCLPQPLYGLLVNHFVTRHRQLGQACGSLIGNGTPQISLAPGPFGNTSDRAALRLVLAAVRGVGSRLISGNWPDPQPAQNRSLEQRRVTGSTL